VVVRAAIDVEGGARLESIRQSLGLAASEPKPALEGERADGGPEGAR
jgi:hypothetical protein